ncbi:hypothetical protein [Aurantiacibacter marinus]|uniref:hypothetical protein n=1 Tax=Aurantiacibacter marinus TaxID=874156 RepID=UPI000A46E386|nr:hypothetical protein [Aurantiacibacter marinus]
MSDEARIFMEAYGEDLENHDREAIIERYASSGAYIVFNGASRYASKSDLESRYLEEWQGPISFSWNELTIDEVSSGVVLVVGTFNWESSDGIALYSYTGLLVGEGDGLRIKLENESILPTE